MSDREAKLYEEELGAEARARQEADRRERHICCGEFVEHGHHFLCSKRPPDEAPPMIEGQASLV